MASLATALIVAATAAFLIAATPSVGPNASAQTTDTTNPLGAAPTAMSIASRIPIKDEPMFGPFGTEPISGPWSDYTSPAPCTNATSGSSSPFETPPAIPIAPSTNLLSGVSEVFSIEGIQGWFGHYTYLGCAFVEVYESPEPPARLAAEQDFTLPAEWVEGDDTSADRTGYARFADCGPVLVRLVSRNIGGSDGIDSRIATAQDALNSIVGNCPTAEVRTAVVTRPRPANTHSGRTSIVVYLVAGALMALIILRFVVVARRHQLRTD